MSQRGFAPIILVSLLAVIALALAVIYTNLNKGEEIINLTQSKPLTLSLSSPSENTSAVDDQILIKGKTLPNTTVVLYSESDEEILQSNTNGDFEGKLFLDSGKNALTISAFSDTGEEKTLNLEVDYNPKS